MPETLPLFPLNTVLFPEGRLALRIFETRYVDMVRMCMREGSGFGVVLIREGAEAGAPAQTFDVGTLARIVDFDQLGDGLLGITASGERRFRILQHGTQPDGLRTGSVEWLTETPVANALPGLEPYAHLLEALLPDLGDLYATVTPRLSDSAWVVARLFEILPLPLADKQQALELEAARRFDLLRALVRINAVPGGEEPD